MMASASSTWLQVHWNVEFIVQEAALGEERFEIKRRSIRGGCSCGLKPAILEIVGTRTAAGDGTLKLRLILTDTTVVRLNQGLNTGFQFAAAEVGWGGHRGFYHARG